MVFQRPNPFPKSIYDNVAWGLKVLGMKDGLDDRVERALTQAALWDEVKDRLKASALSLSGGQQQRLCIARAIAVEPDVVLMDEPASALDPIATAAIEKLMSDLKSEYTFVIVTHNMQQAARVADMTAFFSISRGDEGQRFGELVEYDATQKIFTAPSDNRTEDYVTGPLRLAELGDERVDAHRDVVADRAHFVERPALRVRELPADVALARNDRAGVVAGRDDDVCPARSPVVELVRDVVGRIDADLPKRLRAPPDGRLRRARCRLNARHVARRQRRRKRRSAMTERPLFATQTKSTLLMRRPPRAARTDTRSRRPPLRRAVPADRARARAGRPTRAPARANARDSSTRR